MFTTHPGECPNFLGKLLRLFVGLITDTQSCQNLVLNCESQQVKITQLCAIVPMRTKGMPGMAKYVSTIQVNDGNCSEM